MNEADRAAKANEARLKRERNQQEETAKLRQLHDRKQVVESFQAEAARFLAAMKTAGYPEIREYRLQVRGRGLNGFIGGYRYIKKGGWHVCDCRTYYRGDQVMSDASVLSDGTIFGGPGVSNDLKYIELRILREIIQGMRSLRAKVANER